MGPAVFLLLLSLLSPSSGTTTEQPPDIAACLSSAGVRNFTLPFSTTDEATYYNLLDFSIQNLRFTSPSLPKPSAVILPENLADLQNTIRCCRLSALTIRIRSGGHSYEGLSYLAERQTPFALIDLMNLNRIRVDPNSRTAWVEAGATLGEVYHAVSTSSGGQLGFSAGSCPTVGSGGHIAGGGFGLLSRKHGLAADNVLDAVLVDAGGRALDSRSMGEDVFWAIRGGGGGTWGAVYAWRLRLVPVPARVACFVINRPGSTRDVAGLVDRWQRVAPELPDEFYMSVFVGARLPDAAAPGIMSATFKGFYLGPRSEAESALRRSWFPELNVSESDWKEMSWIESVVFFSGLPKGSAVSDLRNRYLNPKTYFKAKSDYVRAHIELNSLVRAFALLEEEPKAYLILDPYGGAMARVRSDHLPFPHREGNLYTIQYLIEWKEEEEEDESSSRGYVEWLRGLYDSMEEFVSRGPRAAYVNYLDLDLGTTRASVNSSSGGLVYSDDAVTEARTWGEKYFLGNYDRLVRAKTAIDVENVFSNTQSIPPLAPLQGPNLLDNIKPKGMSMTTHNHANVSWGWI